MSENINFLKQVIVTCLFVLIIAAMFNFIIDPYNIFQAIDLPGFNTSKAGAADRVALSKSYMVDKLKAKTIILGSSKIDIGIDPSSRYIPSSCKPMFNFGIPGSGLYEQYRYLQHANSFYKIDLVIIGLEFENFLSKQNTKNLYPPVFMDFENRLKINYDGSNNSRRIIQMFKDYSAALLSNTATYDSIKTIASGETIWLSRAGLSSGQQRFGSETQNKGYNSVFKNTLAHQLKNNQGLVVCDNSVAFKALDSIIHYCYRNNIKIILMIPPSHAFQYELWDMVNLWSEFERWKQSLVEKIGKLEANLKISVPLWDYSYYNGLTTEVVPPPYDKTVMKFYWEPIHFKKNLGDIILNEILSHKPNGMGVKISTSNISKHLAEIRHLRDIYRVRNKFQIEMFRKMLSPRSGS